MFNEDSLAEYITEKNPTVQELMWLKNLLFTGLKSYCDNCEADRMLCVLSPACTERILLKVRFQAGAGKKDLPQFCYSQSVTNLKRFLEKKTTLYEPIDVIFFNEDVITLFFPKLSSLHNLYNEKNSELSIKEMHNMIKKSKIPAINLEEKHVDSQIFRRIMEKDKLIKEGTFIYIIKKYILLIWYEGAIYIFNLKTGNFIANAKKSVINDLYIIELIFSMICAQYNVPGELKFQSENEIALKFSLPLKELDPSIFNESNVFFHDLLETIQTYFYGIHIHIDDESNKFFFNLSYQNVESLLSRIGLSKITYESISQLIEKIASIYNTKKNE